MWLLESSDPVTSHVHAGHHGRERLPHHLLHMQLDFESAREQSAIQLAISMGDQLHECFV